MCKRARLVHRADVRHELHVEVREPVRGHAGVLEPRRWDAVTADKVHDQNVIAQEQRRRGGEPRGDEAREVAHLLLGPGSDHLARVALAVAVSEAPVARDVAVPVLENEDRSLVDLSGDEVLSSHDMPRRAQIAVVKRTKMCEPAKRIRHLDGEVGAGGGVGVIDVRLLPRGDAPVDLLENALVQHLQKHLMMAEEAKVGWAMMRFTTQGTTQQTTSSLRVCLLLSEADRRCGCSYTRRSALQRAHQAGARVERLLDSGSVLLLRHADGDSLPAPRVLADAVGDGGGEAVAVAEVQAILLRGEAAAERGRQGATRRTVGGIVANRCKNCACGRRARARAVETLTLASSLVSLADLGCMEPPAEWRRRLSWWSHLEML